jgi:outer membrane protein OmpA-like peptidoglycan-associated protein
MVELDTQRISDPNHEQIPITDIPPEYIPQKITLKAGVRDTISNTYLEQVDISYNVKRRRLAMLPSVFFDSAQAAIPTRFLQRRVFDDSSMSKGIRDIDVSHSILHVLGSTMQRQPGATVTITGCHAEDVAPEERNRLARARADAVKTHLTSRYGIDSSRVRVLTRAFPERASSVFTPFGRAENRRVDLELQETSYDLPVQSDTLVVASPPKIETLIETTRPESIKKLRVALLADGVEMAAIDTNAAANLVSSPFVLTDSVKRRLLQAKHVEVAVEAQDEIEGSVQQRVSAFNVLARPDEEQPFDEFGIVLFDYNSSRIAESELDVLEDLRARVARADRITITGTSDESGVESENLRLAQERAQTVARALGLKPGMYVLESRIATDYSSYIPEGRMLGRQVKVVLQTGK